jgi:site-specific DNA recombinase
LRNASATRRVRQEAANANADAPARGRVIRCAVYTRKSTDEGLAQEFNSLDAQREAAEAYIASQKHEGWTLITDAYNDGGFTGANMD